MYEIKELVWYSPYLNDNLVRADSIVGVYRVWTFPNAESWFWSVDTQEGRKEGAVPTREDGKLAAKNHYQQLIKSVFV